MLAIVLSVVAGIFYYRVGDHEYGAGFVTAGLSLILSIVTWLVLGWDRFGFFGGQVAFFVGLTWYNGRRIKKHHGGGAP